MLRRYYSKSPIQGDSMRLDDAEAHHLMHVARIQPGERVTLFDGSGSEYTAVVTECRRNFVALSVGECRKVSRELRPAVTVGVPLPKGDRARWLVEKLTELGVSRMTPLTTARSMAPRASDQKKLGRYVIEASKQCGRNVLMEIGPTTPWDDWISQAANTLRLVAHPGGKPVHGWVDVPGDALTLAFGPEGGLTTPEIDAAQAAGWQAMDLGRRILRIETAAVAAVAALTLGRCEKSNESS